MNEPINVAIMVRFGDEPVPLFECPSGAFEPVSNPGLVCFKSDYGLKKAPEAVQAETGYVYACEAFNEAGEYFCSTEGHTDLTMVWPLRIERILIDG